MSEIKTVRWKRYGKDRLYVKDEADAELGWVDLLTGQRSVTDTSREAAFDEAVNSWYVETATAFGSSLTTEPTAVPDPPSAAPEPAQPKPVAEPPAWHDLATHVPGQAASEHAKRELAAMRERTRVGTFLARALDMKPVRSALVLLTGTLIPNVTIKKAPADVGIYDRMDIPGVFKRAPRRIGAEQVEAIYDAARRCTTWTGSPRCSCA